MILNDVFEAYLEDSPVCVMTRAILERALSKERANAFFERVACFQYTRELLFSSVVELMGRVVFRRSPSVGAAFKELKKRDEIGVSATAVYNKLNGLETTTSTELVRFTVERLQPVIESLGANKASPIPGIKVRVIDGNHFAATEHRLEVLRAVKNAPLPAQVVAFYEPALDLVTDILACEDAHAQERSLTQEIVAAVRPNDCIIGDRNFCTTRLLFGIAAAQAFFLIRQHKTNVPGKLVGDRHYLGRTDTGAIFEQQLRVESESEGALRVRRITVVLDAPTRDGETELHLLTNIPKAKATGLLLADLYRTRWTIEGMFQIVTVSLRCEISTLGYPRAALFAFCVAITAYHVLAVERAAISAAHGPQEEERTSDYYLSLEVAATMRGMLVILPPSKWTPFHDCTDTEFASFLRATAARMDLPYYRKSRRGPKKPAPERRVVGRGSHVSTKRLLDARKYPENSP